MISFIAKYWIEFFFGVITTGLIAVNKYLFSRQKKQHEDQQAVKAGVEALLRNEITRIYYESIDRGYIPQYMLESVLRMYEQYTALGGNSFITELVAELKDIPMK